MERSILEWLERSAERFPDKAAYRDDRDILSFGELQREVRTIGGALREKISEASAPDETGTALDVMPVAVLLGRSVHTIAAFLSVVYAGGCYAPIDGGLPAERIRVILDTARPRFLLTDREHSELADSLAYSGRILFLEELRAGSRKAEGADARRGMPADAGERRGTAAGNPGQAAIPTDTGSATDPLYIIFTSGSTGRPKGVITGQASLMNYIEAYREVMDITAEDVLGSQSPLDYIAVIRDIYLPLLTGCTGYLIPKEYFMEPENLFRCLNEQKITAVGWSVSAFTVPAALGAFAEGMPRLQFLRKLCFSGSVMPGGVLRAWQQALPEARFVNQYGPTEATASCTYYPVEHLAKEGEALPIGVPYRNYRVFLLDKEGRAVPQGEEGEICVGGPVLALGYYNDPERTARDFIQNPLNHSFAERIYKTGDYGVMREDGVLLFHGRRDRQVKHMGHRVELDEIEAAALSCPAVRECSAQYRQDKETLYLFYTGDAAPRELILSLRERLPGFMVPRRVKRLEEMPRLASGKTDMTVLRAMM